MEKLVSAHLQLFCRAVCLGCIQCHSDRKSQICNAAKTTTRKQSSSVEKNAPVELKANELNELHTFHKLLLHKQVEERSQEEIWMDEETKCLIDI